MPFVTNLVALPPHGLLHYTHCCTPPQTTIPIIHCTDHTHTHTHTHSWLHWSRSLLKPWTSSLSLLSIVLAFLHSPNVSYYQAFPCLVFVFSLVFLCCLVVWFLTFCLLPGSSLCLALWILFTYRRSRPFTWVLFCLALYMTVCHLFDPACVFDHV